MVKGIRAVAELDSIAKAKIIIWQEAVAEQAAQDTVRKMIAIKA
jgi:hypothetical protein